MYVDESKEEQEQLEEVSVVSSKQCTTIDLTVTSEYELMSVDNTNDELVITRAPIETDKS